MDSTPPPQPLSVKASASKLPVKRKTSDSSSVPENAYAVAVDGFGYDPRPPPLKFHRIWTEPDEIRYLQGLLDCASEGLVFPKDLPIFYSRFSNTMSQPYSKSQLSEKLRRLRKKFRVVSSRLVRGLDESLLSPHDRALYDLSRKLWSPEYSSVSPFCSNNLYCAADINKKKSNSDSNGDLNEVKINFSPKLLLGSNENQIQNHCCDDNDEDEDGAGKVKMRDVNVDYDFDGQDEGSCRPSSSGPSNGGLGGVVAKAVLNVFDQCLKEVRTVLVGQGLLYPDCVASGLSKEGKALLDYEMRWREQRVAELDVLARRLRLVLENPVRGQ
ncbi:hypothetical protein FNV43_RR14901 [Rhamnella rubrinervis]|uniref:Glabrous enhancer-binding protein-like DBD domain-containing protein n=1 Tax=Rhamnella rubrinervis TaxID=2594499 RepID=A0A8K0MGR9_9ROSA|nr:hypothetical protein FNV43_RR14901 [Rhamnella rubrinervis]